MDIGLCVIDEDRYERLYMFQAPNFTLEKDLRVKVDTCNGSKCATVKYFFPDINLNHEMDKNLFDALLKLSGAMLPLAKITHRLREVELDYGDV